MKGNNNTKASVPNNALGTTEQPPRKSWIYGIWLYWGKREEMKKGINFLEWVWITALTDSLCIYLWLKFNNNNNYNSLCIFHSQVGL